MNQASNNNYATQIREAIERRVLAIILADPTSRSTVIYALDRYPFNTATAQRTFLIFKEIYEQNEGFTLSDMTHVIAKSSREPFEVIDYIASLPGEYTSSSFLENDMKFLTRIGGSQILSKFLQESAAELAKKSDFSTTDLHDQIYRITEGLLERAPKTQRPEIPDFGEAVEDGYEEIIRRTQNTSEITGVSVNMKKLDSITLGFQPQDLIVIAARPGAGKTAISLNFFVEAARRIKDQRDVIVFFSLEMGQRQLMHRLYSKIGRIDHHSIRLGKLNSEERDALEYARSELRRLQKQMIIIDDPYMTVPRINAKLRQIEKRGQHIKMVFVDYLQLLSTEAGKETGRISSRQEEVALMSKGLKGTARNFNIPLIALAQLSRKIEERRAGEDRPLLSDLRESGAIEQDADLVCFLYAPKVDQALESKDARASNIANIQLIIAKHRNGSTGEVDLIFIKNKNIISETQNGPAAAPTNAYVS